MLDMMQVRKLAPHYPDPACAPRPFTGPRFKVYVRGVDPGDTVDGESWSHKLDVVDNAYMDSDGLPIYSIAAGGSWDEAYRRAATFIRSALASDRCIF